MVKKVPENETPEPVEDEVVEETEEIDDVKVEVEATPITVSQITDRADELFTKAKAAGAGPIKVAIGAYLMRGLKVFDSLLDGLAGDDDEKKRPKE